MIEPKGNIDKNAPSMNLHHLHYHRGQRGLFEKGVQFGEGSRMNVGLGVIEWKCEMTYVYNS